MAQQKTGNGHHESSPWSSPRSSPESRVQILQCPCWREPRVKLYGRSSKGESTVLLLYCNHNSFAWLVQSVSELYTYAWKYLLQLSVTTDRRNVGREFTVRKVDR